MYGMECKDVFLEIGWYDYLFTSLKFYSSYDKIVNYYPLRYKINTIFLPDK